MIIIKIAGFTLLISTATALGFYAAAKGENQLKNLNQFIIYITELRDRIMYDGSEIYLLINKIFGDSKLLCFKDGKFTLNNINIRCEEKRILDEFFSNLGTTEQQGEISRAEFCIISLKERQKQISKEIYEKSRLYRILGICSGILVSIIFI